MDENNQNNPYQVPSPPGLPNNAPPQPPLTPEQTPPNPYVLPTPQPTFQQSQVSPTPYVPPKRARFSFSPKAFFIALLGLLVLGGGSAAAYLGYVVPNRPNNVLMSALSNLVNNKDPLSFDAQVNLKGKGAQSLVTAVTIDAKGGTDGGINGRLDLRFEVSAFKLTASTIVRGDDKTLYMRIDELPSLLELSGLSANTQTRGLIQKLNSNWVEINVADAQSAGFITKKQAQQANSCIDSLASFYKTKRQTYQDALVDAYKEHMFISATKVGNDQINGVTATKYKLTVDEAKANAFGDAVDNKLKNTASIVDKACGTTTANQSTKKDTQQTITDSSVKDTYAWVGPHKKLVKFSTFIGSKDIDTNISITLGNEKVDTNKPSNIVTLKELKDLLGSQSSYTRGLQNQILNF